MSVISKRFADELGEKEMREAYLSAQIRTKLTSQIRTIRSQRGWSQGDFARELGKPQSNVSQRLENREYGQFTLSTLLEIAAAFDVGLVVEFVPYEDFLRRTQDLSATRLQVSAFSRSALEPLCQDVSLPIDVSATVSYANATGASTQLIAGFEIAQSAGSIIILSGDINQIAMPFDTGAIATADIGVGAAALIESQPSFDVRRWWEALHHA
jgi:transcriptional regulator with XRE-family HTH domain